MPPSAPASTIDEVVLHLRMMAAEVDMLSGAAAEHLRLNRTELRALHCLRALGNSATAGDLARMLALTTGATTRVIDGLVDHGHARRIPDAQDRRRTVVNLTPGAIATLRGLFAPLGAEMRGELSEIDDAVLTGTSSVLQAARRLMREHAHRLHGTTSAAIGAPLTPLTEAHRGDRA